MSERARTMVQQLDNTTQAYLAAKDEFERARINFEAEQFKLSGLRDLAKNVLTDGEMTTWRLDHRSIRYAGIGIGEAVEAVLIDHVATLGFAEQRRKEEAESYRGPEAKDATPRTINFLSLTSDQIIQRLEEGGFAFSSPTPKRELNAAFMKLKSVRKDRGGLHYHVLTPQVWRSAAFDSEGEALKGSDYE